MQASQELELVDNQRFHIYYEDANNWHFKFLTTTFQHCKSVILERRWVLSMIFFSVSNMKQKRISRVYNFKQNENLFSNNKVVRIEITGYQHLRTGCKTNNQAKHNN